MIKGNRTILLVEDSADDAALFQRGLKKAGISYPVRLVEDGRKAMDYLSGEGIYADRSHYPCPSLIFLDLKLPGRDGFEVLTWMRKQPAFESIPVIILSASEDGLDHQKAYALGARSYLVKPADPEELLRVMASMQIYWSRFGENEPTSTPHS